MNDITGAPVVADITDLKGFETPEAFIGTIVIISEAAVSSDDYANCEKGNTQIALKIEVCDMLEAEGMQLMNMDPSGFLDIVMGWLSLEHALKRSDVTTGTAKTIATLGGIFSFTELHDTLGYLLLLDGNAAPEAYFRCTTWDKQVVRVKINVL